MNKYFDFFLSTKTVCYVTLIGILGVSLMFINEGQQSFWSFESIFGALSSGFLLLFSSVLLTTLYLLKNRTRFLKIFLGFMCLPTIYILTAISVFAGIYSSLTPLNEAMMFTIIYFMLPVQAIPIGMLIGLIIASADYAAERE